METPTNLLSERSGALKHIFHRCYAVDMAFLCYVILYISYYFIFYGSLKPFIMDLPCPLHKS